MKILHVEDESLLALALEEQLRVAGHEIVGPVCDYAQALALATEHRPALAVVDMEIANAEERTRLVWSLNGLLDVPSIVLTSRPQNVTRCEGAVVAVLHKPFQLEDILPAVDLAAERLGADARAELLSRRADRLGARAVQNTQDAKRRGTHPA